MRIIRKKDLSLEAFFSFHDSKLDVTTGKVSTRYRYVSRLPYNNFVTVFIQRDSYLRRKEVAGSIFEFLNGLCTYTVLCHII